MQPPWSTELSSTILIDFTPSISAIKFCLFSAASFKSARLTFIIIFPFALTLRKASTTLEIIISRWFSDITLITLREIRSTKDTISFSVSFKISALLSWARSSTTCVLSIRRSTSAFPSAYPPSLPSVLPCSFASLRSVSKDFLTSVSSSPAFNLASSIIFCASSSACCFKTWASSVCLLTSVKAAFCASCTMFSASALAEEIILSLSSSHWALNFSASRRSSSAVGPKYASTLSMTSALSSIVVKWGISGYIDGESITTLSPVVTNSPDLKTAFNISQPLSNIS